jgi:hypothetical protein
MKKILLALLAFSTLSFVVLPGMDDLPMNKIQVIGSHNSYKKAIDPALFKLIKSRDSAGASKIDYEHISFTDQLNLGLQNLEIDIYADEKGGRYAKPKGLLFAPGQAPYDPNGEMLQPGFKILHIPDLDFRSQAATLAACLKELRQWSVANPNHLPIFITLEPKGDTVKALKLTDPEPFTEKVLDELDQTMLTNLGKDQLITPDMVRGKYETLEEAVLHDNWPKLKNARGKFIFVMDNHNRIRDTYTAGHPSLKGRTLFTNSDAGSPEAAFMIRNNPQDPLIPELVQKGYIIRTRADADTKEARTNDYSGFEAAKKSGAQVITTDYYLKSTHFKSDYVVSFDGDHKYYRLNPIFQQK